MTQYPGKAQDLARDVFDETIVDAGGVIFFVKYEHHFQIATHGPKNNGGSFTVCNQKNGQRSKRRSCYSHMAPRESHPIWVWRYWNLQLLLTVSRFLQKGATFWKGNQQSI